MQNVQLNVVADAPDDRDYDYVPPPDLLAAPPAAVDLRTPSSFPAIYTQGGLNSCTAQSVAAVLYFNMRKQALADAFDPSRLFIYYNERYLAHEIGNPRYGNHGAPARMRDCIKTVSATGFCGETHWPYREAMFDTKPAEPAYTVASRYRSYAYFRLAQDVAHLKACLAEGYPFVCGIVVYESFLAPAARRTGIVPLPSDDEIMRGGHAVAVVGYDDAHKRFIARNSFGPKWGDQGHCYLPYDFLCDARYGLDFWVIKSVNETKGGEPAADGSIV